ncbi:MAG: hypothetical protein HY231_24190 [Acidobacteria bacterium]|nr:hypothetical protein [Acidobacteriota bacterium]
MDEELLYLCQDVDMAANDCNRFGGNVAYEAERKNFDYVNANIEQAIASAKSLVARLDSLKRFVQSHSELSK